MKKKTKVIVITIISVIVLLAIAIAVGINIAGNYVVNTIVNSVDDKTIDELQKAAGEINPETIDLQPENEEITKPNDEKVEEITPDDANNVKASKKSEIDYADKIDAISLATSKFSFSEINMYRNRYYSEGMTAKLVADLKADLKARCTPAEIEQIRKWYYKYK